MLTVLVVAVCLLAGYAFKQRQQATAARDVAITAQQDANSHEVANEAEQLRALDPALAAQLSVAAYGIARTQQATAALLESTDTAAAARIADSSGIVQAVAVSPDRRLLAAVGADGTLRLWNVTDPAHATPVGQPLQPANSDLPLYTVAFSPDGKVLAAAGAGREVKLWDVSNPARPVPLGAPLTGPRNTIYSVVFSPDGHTLAAASADDTVRLWNVTDPAHARPLGRPLTGPTGYVQTVAFSADGGLLAAGSGNSVAGGHDDTVWVWNVADPARPRLLRGMPLTGPASVVSGVAFSPSGGLLAASSQDDKIWLWKISAAGRAAPDGTLTNSTNWVNTVAFSPSGGYLAAGTSEARVLVWNTATRALTASMALPQPVTTVAWDGARTGGGGRRRRNRLDMDASVPGAARRQRVRFGRVLPRRHHDGRRRDQSRALVNRQPDADRLAPAPRRRVRQRHRVRPAPGTTSRLPTATAPRSCSTPGRWRR